MVDASLYRRMVEQAKDYALFLLDPAGVIVSWNEGARRIKGYQPDEIIGRHFSVFYTPDALERGWPAHELKVATLEGRFEDEGWRVRRDGSRFWANVVITALRDDDGKLLGFSKITRDLTERRQQEEALRQSEQRFRLLLEGVHDYAVFMLDPEGIVSSWNQGAQRLKGYTPEEIIGKHFSRFYSAEDVFSGKPWQLLTLARRDGRAEDEAWRLRKDGTRFWARVVLTALEDSRGRLRGFAKVTQDLTERHQLRELEKAARNVNEFIGMLAHELRNPLAPIRSAVDVLGRTGVLAPEQEAMREVIERQSAQLQRIVDDMVDIVRVSRGSLQMVLAPLALDEAIRVACETAEPAMRAAGHHLRLDVAGGLVVNGDASRLIQLFANLLNNAARYTPGGGRIEVVARAQDDCAVVSVKDNGRGIEPQLIGRIFDMFVQGRSPLQRVGGGLGIGLALARNIAELHGGTVTAHSEGEGKGSEFRLRLPLLAAADRPPVAARGAPQPAGAPKRILVVDDNVDAAASLGMLLESLGHEARVVHDGAEALRVAPQFSPDIVLLDIGMPGMDGYEVARRLAALKKDRPFRLVAVTGWGQEADRTRAREAGFDVHLVKPVDLNQLHGALDERGGATLH